jgi:hypothetical protein
LESPSPQPGPFEQQWKRVEWDVSQKVKIKETNETKRCVWTSITHGNVKEGQVLILFAPSETNLPKPFIACLNHPFYKVISVGMIF